MGKNKNEGKIVSVEFEEEIEKAYIDYAMSVIVGRAIPDVRDGLKPVHRRILYAMNSIGLTNDKSFRKSATVVGEVLGKYHPHGDSAVYDAMVRLSQDFKMRVPLVTGHGNFGSVDGDSAAAMRYTESKLSKESSFILSDMGKSTVDFVDNFDSSLKEPTVLPGLFPNLLINGVSGIAVGMATEIPPHNPDEIIDAINIFSKNENVEIYELLKEIKGPDFPSAGIIVNKEDLNELYETGRGKVKVRSKIEVEDISGGRKNLVVTEIPYSYSGSKQNLLDKIASMIKDRKFEEISDFRDESSKEGIRIVLEIKKGIDPNKVINKLYKRTPLEDNISLNFLVIDKNKNPKVMNIKELISAYLEHQIEVQERKYNFLLEKALKREEIVTGLVKAYDLIDLIIEVIRGSKTVGDAKKCLMGEESNTSFKTKDSEKKAKALNFSLSQAEAILDMRLSKLISLELDSLKDELNGLNDDITKYKDILSSRENIKKQIRKDLRVMKKEISSKRKTEIIQADEIVLSKEDESDEEVFIVLDKFSYLKVIDSSSLSRANPQTLEDFKHIIKGRNLSKLLILTDEPSLCSVKIKELPKGKIRDKGALVDTIIEGINKNTNPLLITSLSEIEDKELLFITRNGKIKKVKGKDFDVTRKVSQLTKTEENDKLLKISVIEDNHDEIIILSNKGNVFRYSLDEVSIMGKTAVGMMACKIKEDEEILDFITYDSKSLEGINLGKEDIPLDDIKLGKRMAKGILLDFSAQKINYTIKEQAKTEEVKVKETETETETEEEVVESSQES